MLIVLKLLGSIALLIYDMKVMSEALQKMAGPQLRHLLGSMTKNRFSGVAMVTISSTWPRPVLETQSAYKYYI